MSKKRLVFLAVSLGVVAGIPAWLGLHDEKHNSQTSPEARKGGDGRSVDLDAKAELPRKPESLATGATTNKTMAALKRPNPQNHAQPRREERGSTRRTGGATTGDSESSQIEKWDGLLIDRDIIDDSNGRIVERSLYRVKNVIGRVIKLKMASAPEASAEYYSGRALVLQSPGSVEYESWIAKLQAGGLTIERPEHTKRFVRVIIPEESLRSLDAVTAASIALADKNRVELDGIGWGGAVTVDDPLFQSQWNLSKIEVEGAWSYSTGSSSVLVAVLDSGIAGHLPEFSGRLVDGFDFVNGDSDPADDSFWDGGFTGHGTAVASIIGANTNNGNQLAGIDWNCQILPLKVLDGDLSGTYSTWAVAVDYAVSRGARVINLSAGGTGNSKVLSDAISDAIESGAIFVTITHNDGNASVSFPGSIAEAITVGATSFVDSRANFSNSGNGIDLVAPGLGVWALADDGIVYNDWSGTSFAAPHVSAVASLMLAQRPEISPEDVFRTLAFAADDEVGNPFEDTTGFDNFHGWGRLNARKSLRINGAQATLEKNSTGFVVSWPSIADPTGKNGYQIEYSDDLEVWTTVDAPQLSSENGQSMWVVEDSDLPATGTGGQFYRISLKPFQPE